MEKDKAWARVLSIKYRNPKRSGSNVWVGMKHGGSIFAQGIKWKVDANSNLNFWHDKWLLTGNVRSMIEGPLWRDEEYCLVRDMRNEGNWDFSRCSFDFPNKLTLLLKAITFPTNHWGEDKIVWASSLPGDFEQKSAYAIARGDCNSSHSFNGKWIWKIDSMPKIKTFIWKCFLHSIPVGEVLQERGIIQDAQCRICNNGRESNPTCS